MSAEQPVHDFDCAVCGQRIEKPSDGFLAVDDHAAVQTEMAWSDYERRPVSERWVNFDTLAALPDLVPWQPRHYKCRDGRFRYEIELERITQWWQVADWTAHLLETRSWLRCTDWYALLRHFAGQGVNESPA